MGLKAWRIAASGSPEYEAQAQSAITGPSRMAAPAFLQPDVSLGSRTRLASLWICNIRV